MDAGVVFGPGFPSTYVTRFFELLEVVIDPDCVHLGLRPNLITGLERRFVFDGAYRDRNEVGAFFQNLKQARPAFAAEFPLNLVPALSRHGMFIRSTAQDAERFLPKNQYGGKYTSCELLAVRAVTNKRAKRVSLAFVTDLAT